MDSLALPHQNPNVSPWLAGAFLLYVLMRLSLHVCLSPNVLFVQGHQPFGSQPTYNLILGSLTSLMVTPPNSHSLKPWGFEDGFGGRHSAAPRDFLWAAGLWPVRTALPTGKAKLWHTHSYMLGQHTEKPCGSDVWQLGLDLMHRLTDMMWSATRNDCIYFISFYFSEI